MNRVSTLIIGALFAIAAVEFGLLGASASGLTGGNDSNLPPVSERLGVDPTPTATPTLTENIATCIDLEHEFCGADLTQLPAATATNTYTTCGSQACPTPTPPPPTRTPTPCAGPCPPTLTPFSPPSCDPEEQFCPTSTPVTPTPISPPQLSPPSVDATGIDIRANPLTIECDGYDRSTVTVRIFDANGNPVPDGTWVYFNPYNGNADPWSATTTDGYATTQVSFYGGIFPYGPNLIVESGLLQAGIRIRCNPQSNPCPPSPPTTSPPCEEPTPTPTPYPCNPSPGSGPLSPPCEPEPPCAVSPPSVSPPCEESPASPPTAFELALDCDIAASGIQSYCVTSSAAPRDVGVVLTNMSGADIGLAAFNFTVNNADISIIDPLPGIDTSPPNHNNNPDFNEAALSAPGWECLPVIPDLTPGGPSSASLLSCFNGQGSAAIADGDTLVLAVVHYGAGSQPGSTFMSIESAAFYDDSLSELGSCNPTIDIEMNCHGASVELPYPPPPASGFEMAVDCNPSAAGIQTACNATAGSATDVDIVVSNNSGSDVALGALGFTLVNTDRNVLEPLPNPEIDALALDGNPDFDQDSLPDSGWQCAPPPPTPDWIPGGIETESLLGCFNIFATSGTFQAGASIVIATVHYTAGSTGVTDLYVVDGSLYDQNFGDLASCDPIITLSMECLGATVSITSGGPIGPPATSTATPTPAATDTPIPTATFTSTPAPPTSTSTHTATATAVPPTPTPTPAPAGNRCADVNGDGRVTRADIREILRRVHSGPYIAKYDINRDGKLAARDSRRRHAPARKKVLALDRTLHNSIDNHDGGLRYQSA